jgi:hypothetical protein
MAAQVLQQKKNEKAFSFGEINPFDPKVNIIVLNGDILPTVSSVQVPGLRPRRKIASLPGRFVTLPIPDKLEGDFLPPDDMNPGTIVAAIPLDESGAGHLNKTRISPRVTGLSPKSSNYSLLRPTTPGRKLGSPHNAGSPGGKKTSPRAGSDGNHEEKAFDFSHVADDDAAKTEAAENKALLGTTSTPGSMYNKFNLQITTEANAVTAEDNVNNEHIASQPAPPVQLSLEDNVNEKIEYLEDVCNAMFHLYAWANMTDSERKSAQDKPTITYEETVTKIRDLVNWTDFASKKKFQSTASQEKDVIRPLYMKLLTLLMVHASIATGCDMNDVMHWHGHHVGYRVGKYIWTLAELQGAVDDSFGAGSPSANAV